MYLLIRIAHVDYNYYLGPFYHSIFNICSSFRDANSLLRKAKEGDLESVNAIYGTFACQASNIAGTGEKCSISIDGPPSALVADTDTTYLIFGGASVLLLLFIIVASIVVCRRQSVSKYGASNSANATTDTASTLTQGYNLSKRLLCVK